MLRVSYKVTTHTRNNAISAGIVHQFRLPAILSGGRLNAYPVDVTRQEFGNLILQIVYPFVFEHKLGGMTRKSTVNI